MKFSFFRFKRIGDRILLLVGISVFAGLFALSDFHTQRQETMIVEQHKQILYFLIRSVNEGIEAIMLSGDAGIANEYAKHLKHISEIRSFKIMRINGQEAFKDNETIKEVNARLGNEEFTLHEITALEQVLPADDKDLQQSIATKSQITNTMLDPETKIPYMTVLAPILNNKPCHRCHSSKHAVRGVVMLTFSMAAVTEAIKQTRTKSTIILSVAMAGVLAMIMLLMRYSVVLPIGRVTEAMSAVAVGNLAHRVPEIGMDELGRMAMNFNQMSSELAKVHLGLKNEQEKLTKARNQAEKSRIMLRQVLDTIPVNVFWKDVDLCYMGCNTRFAAFAGIQDPKDIINRYDCELAWSAYAETFQSRDRQVISTGESHLNFLEQLLMPDGSKRWLEISKVPLTDPDGNIIGVLGASHDVTERHLLEEELKFSRFSVMNTKDAIYWIDSNARFINVNQEACLSLGFTREELLSLTLHAISPEMQVTQWPQFWNEMTTKRTMVFTTSHQCKDQSIFPVEVSINILEYQGSSFAMASTRNITERKLAEQSLQDYADKLEEKVQARTKQLIHAERLATLGTFSAGMAHEINNPNAFITANIQFLQQYWLLAHPILLLHANEDPSGRLARFQGEIFKTLEGILDGSARISKIVDSLKTYSKGGMETDRVVCRLEDLVRDAENLLHHRILNDKATLTVKIPKNLMIYCDRQQMAQVFVNLFNNALDALEEMHGQHDKQVSVEGQLIARHVWVWVKDNGPGIPDAVIGKIFDPFYTSKGKTKGTGLGLSIVEGIIKDHRGQITIFSPSEPERETEVVIILPTIELYQEQLTANNQHRHKSAARSVL